MFQKLHPVAPVQMRLEAPDPLRNDVFHERGNEGIRLQDGDEKRQTPELLAARGNKANLFFGQVAEPGQDELAVFVGRGLASVLEEVLGKYESEDLVPVVFVGKKSSHDPGLPAE